MLASYVKQGRFYKSVVEDGRDIIFVVDFEGKILYHNKSVYGTLGYPGVSLVGKIFFDYVEPVTVEVFKKQYSKAIRKAYTSGVECKFLCKDKTYKYLEFNAINLWTKEKMPGLILDCRDVTQRKKDADELLRAQKAKEQFLANISHEIRTPINGIAGMANLLSQNPDTSQRDAYLQAIISATNNLKVIINDILDLASIDSGKIKLEKIGFNLNDLLATLVQTFQVQALEKKIGLTYQLSQPKVVLIGDPVRLNQILINLLSNALKFTQQGSIQISAQIEKADARHALLKIDVSDTGIGIAKDKLKRIFESFSQADASVTRKYGGTGLGLTIVKQLVKLQRGTIKVVSEEGKGSVFSATLPYLIGKPQDITELSARATEDQSQKESLSQLKILLVEDNEINQLYASTILRSWKCETTVAENGVVALERLKSTVFDVILMDIQMPVMDGFETTLAIRKGNVQSAIPIIALTANATQNHIERCIELGMNDFLSKPFAPEDLYRMLIKFTQEKEISIKRTKNEITQPTSIVTPNLAHLQKVSSNDLVFIRDMVDTFIQTSASRLADLQKSLASRDINQIGKILHQLKPSLTMLGFNSLKEMADQLEQSSETGSLSDQAAEEFITLLGQAIESCKKMKGGN
jgi:PAS domain S-box-containing protein